MKKLIPTIPVGAFHLILQAMVQPHIMIQHVNDLAMSNQVNRNVLI